jgi:uncharacterized protein
VKRVFVDTSAWYAYVRRDDPDHEPVAAALERFQGRLVTSNFVFDEVVTLVAVRLGHGAASKVGDALLDAGTVELIRVEEEDESDAWELFRKRPDKGFSFTDCASFALMKRLRLATAVSTDRHFRQAGFEALPG